MRTHISIAFVAIYILKNNENIINNLTEFKFI